MKPPHRQLVSLSLTAFCGLSALLLAARTASAHEEFTSFEARHVHPIALTPDGTRLLALNSPDAHLSVFDVSNAANPAPVLISEIPVGLEPCSVRAHTNDEVWVVNEESDSVSIVSLAAGVVIETLRASDEPGDVVFAQGRAFVSCARNSLVRVFDVTTRIEIATIPLVGTSPRALCTDAAGTKVFAAFLHSGNHTTILPEPQAPAQPAPTNNALPAPPRVALIVASNDPRVNWTTLDNDVAEINASSLVVTRYLSDAGTSLFDVAARPGSDELWVANTEARNLIRFEPALRGHIADNRVTRINLTTAAPTAFDLNPGIDYSQLPNPAQLTALAQPTAVVFSADGATLWVAAFASDRVAKVSAATGAVLSSIDVRTEPSATSAQMRGPRGLVFQAAGNRLFVLNKLSNSISTIDTETLSVTAEIRAGSHDPMPADEREGRGFFFDARLSGNGTASCGTCHLDADRDDLAWDLGDPGGDMVTVMGANLVIEDPTPRPRPMHPMKGPMTTQTLRGITNGAPFHWRGDRPTIQSFNPNFDRLLGGSEITAADMANLAGYLNTLRHHPNPNLNTDSTLPATIAGGNPATGSALFLDHDSNHCTACHSVPGDTHSHVGSAANNIDMHLAIGSTQPVKNPSLATTYQRLGFQRLAGSVNRSGFGLLHDGTGAESALPIAHVFSQQNLNTLQKRLDVAAFVLCSSTGVAPAVGYSRTVTEQNRADSAVIADIVLLESAAPVGRSDLVVRGVVGGSRRSYFYDWFNNVYVEDRAADSTVTRPGLLGMLQGGDALTFMGVIPGEGVRFSIDRNFNGTVNGTEPRPALDLTVLPGAMRVAWPQGAGDWVLESNATLTPPWQTVTLPRTSNAGSFHLDDSTGAAASRFYRLRRAW